MTTQPKARGWRRHHELLRQDAAARDEIIGGLIADLGRAPTTNDLLAIEDIASLTIHARRLERRGQFDRAAVIRDQVSRARRAANFKMQPITPAPAKKKTFVEKIAERAADSTAEAEGVR